MGTLRVVHGAAHGTGIYTANIDAPWLSRGFCTGPSILVCAVLQSDEIRHVRDAMVVRQADHVVPLFEGIAQSMDATLASQKASIAPPTKASVLAVPLKMAVPAA